MAGTPTGRRRPRKRIEIGRNLRPPRRLGRRIRLFGTTHNPRKIRFHAFCSTKLHTHTDQMSTSCSRLTKKRNVPTNLLEREETGERLKCSINTSFYFVKFGLEFYFLQLWNGSKCSSSKRIQKKMDFLLNCSIPVNSLLAHFFQVYKETCGVCSRNVKLTDTLLCDGMDMGKY